GHLAPGASPAHSRRSEDDHGGVDVTCRGGHRPAPTNFYGGRSSAGRGLDCGSDPSRVSKLFKTGWKPPQVSGFSLSPIFLHISLDFRTPQPTNKEFNNQ